MYTSHPNTHRHIITAEEGYVCVYMYAAGSVCVLLGLHVRFRVYFNGWCLCFVGLARQNVVLKVH